MTQIVYIDETLQNKYFRRTSVQPRSSAEIDIYYSYFIDEKLRLREVTFPNVTHLISGGKTVLIPETVFFNPYAILPLPIIVTGTTMLFAFGK